jgi:hypothetical protein
MVLREDIFDRINRCGDLLIAPSSKAPAFNREPAFEVTNGRIPQRASADLPRKLFQGEHGY